MPPAGPLRASMAAKPPGLATAAVQLAVAVAVGAAAGAVFSIAAWDPALPRSFTHSNCLD